VIAVSLLLSTLPQATLRLPALFTDHMVVQRGKPVNIWGWDSPGQKVTVSLGGKSVSSTTDANGKFMLAVPKLTAGGPYTLEVTGSTTVKVSDVLVGEVWVCSGQSNMEWILANSMFREETKKAADPSVRMFTVTKRVSQKPEVDVVGSWIPSAANSVDSFSAVGLAFANKLRRELNVPIGMIHTSWGGTPAEAWTPGYIFADAGTATQGSLIGNMLGPISNVLAAGTKNMDSAIKDYQAKVDVYQQRALPQFLGQIDTTWTRGDFNDGLWEKGSMPITFDANFDGGYYFRRKVTLTASQANAKVLSLGAIDDFDRTFVNGQEVGRTDMKTLNYWESPRSYQIPAGLLHEGENTIAVFAYDTGGAGGFTSTPNTIKLGDLVIASDWKFMKGEVYRPVAPEVAGQQPQSPQGANSPNFPCTLYNGMLAPLAPYSIKGAIWYQGESNAGKAVQYATLLSEMIRGWRKDFGQGNFSFYTAQLANFMAPNRDQFDSAWAELRNSQDIVGQEPNGGTATIIDIGDDKDIHPRNKRDVGERLARIALRKDYGKKIEWQGPRFKSMSAKGDEITITMDHAGGLKTADGQEPRCFAIAGSDKKWKWAPARIEGNKIILKRSGDEAMVRYAWQDNPPVNLVNSDGLPAMPFRTDSLPLITRSNR
jgi:sialate O-acetylesterase